MADIILRPPVNGPDIRLNSPIGPRSGTVHRGTDWGPQTPSKTDQPGSVTSIAGSLHFATNGRDSVSRYFYLGR